MIDMLRIRNETGKLLKQEVKQLRGDYKKIYRNMTIYLASFSLNYYAQQEVLLELAGICLENQKRNIAIEDVFNHDDKAFCDSLIENCKRKQTWKKYWNMRLFWFFSVCWDLFLSVWQ